jgi:hypothetical protein
MVTSPYITTEDCQSLRYSATVAHHLPLGKGFIGIAANAFCLHQTPVTAAAARPLRSFEEMTAGDRAGTLVRRANRRLTMKSPRIESSGPAARITIASSAIGQRG